MTDVADLDVHSGIVALSATKKRTPPHQILLADPSRTPTNASASSSKAVLSRPLFDKYARDVLGLTHATLSGGDARDVLGLTQGNACRRQLLGPMK